MKKIIMITIGAIVLALIAMPAYAEWFESYESSSQEIEFTKQAERQLMLQKQLDDQIRLQKAGVTSESVTVLAEKESSSKLRDVRDDSGNGLTTDTGGGGGKATLGGGGTEPTNEPPKDRGLATATVVSDSTVGNDAVPGTVTDIPEINSPKGSKAH